MHKSILSKCSYLIPLFALISCSYRFSNEAMHAPFGLRKVAIEGVYDTSRDVLPHQYLFTELQRAFAARGKVILTSVEDADIIFRAHIEKSAEQPTDISREENYKDKITVDQIREFKRPDQQVVNLSKAGSWTKMHAVGVFVIVDAWNVHTGKRIFHHTYEGGGSFRSLREDVVHPMGQFLYFEEALNYSMRAAAKNIAEKVVTDFFL